MFLGGGCALSFYVGTLIGEEYNFMKSEGEELKSAPQPPGDVQMTEIKIKNGTVEIEWENYVVYFVYSKGGHDIFVVEYFATEESETGWLITTPDVVNTRIRIGGTP